MGRTFERLRGSGGAAPVVQSALIGATITILVAGLAFLATRQAKTPERLAKELASNPLTAPSGANAPTLVGEGITTTTQTGSTTVTTKTGGGTIGGGSTGGSRAAKGRYANPDEGVFADLIHVGGTAPLQGALAVYAEQGVAGAESRVRFINDKGGINGRKSRLIYYDTQGQCQQALAGTKRLVEVDKLLVYGGTDQVGCVADYLLQKGVPFVGDLGLHRKSYEYPNIFPIGPGPYHAAHLQAKLVTQYPPVAAKRVGIIQLADDFLGPPDELLADVVKAYEFYGAKVVATAKISFDDSNCAPQLQAMRDQNPDFVVLPATINQALLCVTYATKTLLYKPPKGWGGTGLGVQFFADNIPRDAEPVYAGTFYDPIDSSAPGIVEYRTALQRYHPEVDATSFVTFNYYLSAKLNGYLIESCGDAPSRKCLFDKVNSLTKWDTGLGVDLTYRPGNHTPTLKTHILTLKDKSWKFLYRVDTTSPTWWEDTDIPPGKGIFGH